MESNFSRWGACCDAVRVWEVKERDGFEDAETESRRLKPPLVLLLLLPWPLPGWDELLEDWAFMLIFDFGSMFLSFKALG